MQELKFVFDSNVPGAVSDQLVKRGVDAIRCEDVGMADAHDLALLDYAAREQRTLVTADKGFSGWSAQWLEQGRRHSGIFIVTRDKEDIGVNYSPLKPGSLPLALHGDLCIRGVWPID